MGNVCSERGEGAAGVNDEGDWLVGEFSVGEDMGFALLANGEKLKRNCGASGVGVFTSHAVVGKSCNIAVWQR